MSWEPAGAAAGSREPVAGSSVFFAFDQLGVRVRV